MQTSLSLHRKQRAELGVVEFCRDVVESSWFRNYILAMIMLAGVLVGLETNKAILYKYGYILRSLSSLVLLIFVAEASLKILAEGNRPWNYFKDSWNVFDFSLVALCLAEPLFPADTSFLAALRTVRILRILRLVTAIPDLRLLVGTLLLSIPSIAYIGVFLLLLFYIFGTVGVFVFGDNDPIHFGNLPSAFLSLYRVVTLEDWTDIMYINMYGCDKYGYSDLEEFCAAPSATPIFSVIYFVSFVTLGTMIVLNLFIGVVMSSMDRVKEERSIEDLATKRSTEMTSVTDELYILRNQLRETLVHLEMVSQRIDHEMLPRKPEQYGGALDMDVADIDSRS